MEIRAKQRRVTTRCPRVGSVGRGRGCRGGWRRKSLLAEQIHGRLIELGAQLVALVGARDVAHGDLDAANDRLHVDGRGG
jgi:hypothetical protein